jgi:hypothetical protein
MNRGCHHHSQFNSAVCWLLVRAHGTFSKERGKRRKISRKVKGQYTHSFFCERENKKEGDNHADGICTYATYMQQA